MAELSPTFGLVQKGQEKVWQQEGNCVQELEIPHCSTLSFPFPASHWVFEPSLSV